MIRIRDKISTFGLLLLLFGCGGYLLWGTIIALYRVHLSRSWPTTSARIEAVSSSSLGNQKIEVWYSYKVEGVTYRSTTIDLPHLSADQLYEAMEFGRSLPVHYDPDTPATSVLDPGFVATRAVWLLGGLLYLFGGTAGIASFLSRSRDYREARLCKAA